MEALPLLLAVIGIAIAIGYLLTLKTALERVSPQNRLMEPAAVWLNLIPIVQLFWVFITVSRVSGSLANEYQSRRSDDGSDYGKKIGLWGCGCGLLASFLSLVPLAGLVFAVGAMALKVVYWIKVSQYSAAIASDAPAGTSESGVNEENAITRRVNRAIKTTQGADPRTVFAGILVVAVGAFALFYLYQSRKTGLDRAADQWLRLDQGTAASLRDLVSKRSSASTSQGKAARLQVAWNEYWNDAVRLLGINPKEAVAKLDRAAAEYRDIVKESKNDPFFLPEALYALAAIEETRAIVDPKSLESARDLYRDLGSKHVDSAYGQLAKKRADMLDDQTKFDETQRFYTQLSRSRFMPDFAPPPAP